MTRNKTCAVRMIVESNNLTDLIRGQDFRHEREEKSRTYAIAPMTLTSFQTEEFFRCKWCDCLIPMSSIA